MTGASSGCPGPAFAHITVHRVEPHPHQHPVVIRAQRFPAELAATVEAQPVPRADQPAAVHLAGGQVGAQMRQAAGPCRVRCWSRQATISTPSTWVPNGRSVRTSVLAAKAYQFPLGLRRARQGGIDDLRLGVLIRGLLHAPLEFWNELQRYVFGPSVGQP